MQSVWGFRTWGSHVIFQCLLGGRASICDSVEILLFRGSRARQNIMNALMYLIWIINIQNLIWDSLERSLYMLKPSTSRETDLASSLEVSNTMGSSLTIFMQEGAMEKIHENKPISPAIFCCKHFKQLWVHESWDESCCAQNLAMRKSLRAWVHDVNVARCHGCDEWRALEPPEAPEGWGGSRLAMPWKKKIPYGYPEMKIPAS